MGTRWMRCSVLALIAVVLTSAASLAEVRLPAVFSDHLVLQREKPIRVWGWADPGEKVTVSLDQARASAIADREGRWRAELPPRPAGGPTTLVVEGTNRLERSDVLIGEVWLASGQSNMQWSVEASDSAAAEIAVADYPQLRLFSIKREVGRRLALWALARTYGRDRLVYSGPLVAEAMAEPGAVRLRFDHVGNGLAARDGQPLSWFEMAAADGRFRPALARIDGSTIVLTSPEVTAPVQARLGWSEEASPNLINREGLPASPFWIEVRSR